MANFYVPSSFNYDLSSIGECLNHVFNIPFVNDPIVTTFLFETIIFRCAREFRIIFLQILMVLAVATVFVFPTLVVVAIQVSQKCLMFIITAEICWRESPLVVPGGVMMNGNHMRAM